MKKQMKIAIFGICGRMGNAIAAGLSAYPEFDIVAGVDSKVGPLSSEVIKIGQLEIPVYNNIEELERSGADLDVMVDFSNKSAFLANARWCASRGIHLIVGTTGLEVSEVEEARSRFESSKANMLIAPNFSIGAVLMMKFCEVASKYMECCEIIEMHHDGKADSPSGTAIATAERMREAARRPSRLKPNEIEKFEGSRGAFVNGVHIHSVRLPGLVAHQEVIFGGKGQVLSIRHDAMERSAYIPGIAIALRKINELPHFSFGLESVLDL